MGGANNICSDKTGTLTQNVMTMTMLWQDGSHKIAADTPKTEIPSEAARTQLGIAICCNSLGTVEKSGSTDKAMLKVADAWGYTTDKMRREYPEGVRFQFDSTRKRIATIVEDKSLPYPKRLYTKGASETIIANCTHYLDQNGIE